MFAIYLLWVDVFGGPRPDSLCNSIDKPLKGSQVT